MLIPHTFPGLSRSILHSIYLTMCNDDYDDWGGGQAVFDSALKISEDMYIYIYLFQAYCTLTVWVRLCMAVSRGRWSKEVHTGHISFREAWLTFEPSAVGADAKAIALVSMHVRRPKPSVVPRSSGKDKGTKTVRAE